MSLSGNENVGRRCGLNLGFKQGVRAGEDFFDSVEAFLKGIWDSIRDRIRK